MTAITAKRGADLEAQICAAFDSMSGEVSVFVWLPESHKLFEAFRSPRVDMRDWTVEEGYEVEIYPVRYSAPLQRAMLRDLGLLREGAR